MSYLLLCKTSTGIRSAVYSLLYQAAFICISLLSPRHTPRRTKTYACVDSSSTPRSAFECNLVLVLFIAL
jgi:hypothetical protein